MSKMKLYMSKNERDELLESLDKIDKATVADICKGYVELFDSKFEKNINKYHEYMKDTGTDQDYDADHREFFVVDYPDAIWDYLEKNKDKITEVPYFLEKQIIKRHK